MQMRFPVKADTSKDAYLLPSNRGSGSIPWEDAIPVIERWYSGGRNLEERFDQAMKRLADSGGLDHRSMDGFSSEHYDSWSCKMLPSIDWRKNFIADVTDSKKKCIDTPFPRSLSEYVLFSTVRIQTFGENTKGFATGFLFDLIHNENSKRIVVTNKHVFDETQNAIFSFHRSSENSTPAGCQFEYSVESMSHIVKHPDSEIDLCYLPYDLVEQASYNCGVKLYPVFLSPELIPDPQTLASLPLTQEVYMYGYPIGLWDTYNHLPIVRRGSLASPPLLDYCGNPTGAVDIATFPGSSGSPIFVINDGGFINDKLGNVWENRRVAVFLGVLASGAQMKADGTLDMIAIPVQHQQIARGRMLPIHLGYYIKSEEVVRFAMQY